ncbi:hypothetical protein ALP75_200287 [Pseudomonas syringae pv. actinidiae]|nr:hypothetical protein ALP75_200287 [Pseudomonas syringae pv. actinidiae]
MQLVVVRHCREQFGIVIKRLDHRVVRASQGAMLLLSGTGQVSHQLCRQLGVGAVSRNGKAPASECGSVGAVGSAAGQGGDADLAFYRAVRALHQRPDIRPVAHEQCVPRLEYAAPLFLGVVEYAARRNVADPAFRQGQRGFRGRTVHHNVPFRVDQPAFRLAADPFQGVARQALIGAPLEDITPHIGVPCLAFGLLHVPGGGRHVFPGLGNRLLVLIEQVLAVIQQPRVGEPGHRHQSAVNGGVVHLSLEIALCRIRWK